MDGKHSETPTKIVKFDDLTKFALALNTPSKVGTPTSKSRKKQHQELSRRLRVASLASSGSLARENAPELSAIRSVEELELDFSSALSVKRGDLAIIQGEVYRCYPKAPHLSDIPLILRRLDCVDRRIYDLKVYEADTFMRFQGHANIVSLYSYWSEAPPNQYTFKTLVMLEENCVGGSMSNVVVAPERPSQRTILKWCTDIAKGLIAFHNCNIIHGRIKPSSIHLDAHRNALLGMVGKVELDSARQTHQLFSKILIGRAIPHTLVYWAPELLRLDRYGKQVDMWALGVALYELCTGVHPFNVEDETAFRDEAMNATVDFERLNEFPYVKTIIENLLLADPEDRWTAHFVLAYAQQFFAVDVQRLWRGYSQRKKYVNHWALIVKLQAWVRGRLQKIRFKKMRDQVYSESSTMIQSEYRKHAAQKKFNDVKSMFMKCQARVLGRQCRESYLQYRQCVVLCQAQARKFITQRWFDRIREGRAVLESKLRTLQAMVIKYREESREYSAMFAESKLPRALEYLHTFEDYELSLPSELAAERTALPRLRTAEVRIESTHRELEAVRGRMSELEKEREGEKASDQTLKKELGIKYPEFGPMVEALKRNLKRVAEQCTRAEDLPIAMQHTYTYSKWDSVHEPQNVVENVLDDTDSVYRAVAPKIDLTLFSEEVCFVSEVSIEPGEPGPAVVEIFTSNVPEKWTLISTHKCNRDPVQVFQLPGEPLCKFIRIAMKNNIRGGNIVSVKRVRVKGLVQEN
eukprot:TRINITY_DN360_c1_g1_i2.p1 TRINITY_DN360_c1_g1~~TRINITY_DN360_c1_g1_i2.p1  ORF type:complete len:750 (-),score=175.24 TRINITY_DN360_c1_g1_i2:546-2795(-)